MKCTRKNILARRFVYMSEAALGLERRLGNEALPFNTTDGSSTGFKFQEGFLKIKVYYHSDKLATIEAFWRNELVCQHKEGDAFAEFDANAAAETNLFNLTEKLIVDLVSHGH